MFKPDIYPSFIWSCDKFCPTTHKSSQIIPFFRPVRARGGRGKTAAAAAAAVSDEDYEYY